MFEMSKCPWDELRDGNMKFKFETDPTFDTNEF